MVTRLLFALCIALATVASLRAQDGRGSTSVEIDLQDQTAYLIENGEVVIATPISSGRYGHLTQTGSFQIIAKERNHYSNLYGKIVDSRGKTVIADADADMPVSRGGRFMPAPMRYFMRYNGAEGMHAGHLPGHPASHGCVRLPESNAIEFFEAVQVGTPVTVFGITLRSRSADERGYATRRRRRGFDEQRYDPRFEERFARPLWWR